MTESESSTKAIDQLQRDLTRVRHDLDAVRILFLRSAVAVDAVLLVCGLILPMFREERDGKLVTSSVLTAGFQVLSDPGEGGDRGISIALGIGFLGLLLVVLLLMGALWGSTSGSTSVGLLRKWLVALAIIGSVVAVIFSLVAWASTESDTDGGWGPMILLIGVCVAGVILLGKGWQVLRPQVNRSGPNGRAYR